MLKVKNKSVAECPVEEVREEAVDMLARLLGKEVKQAESTAQSLRSLAMELKELEVNSEIAVFKAIADPARLLILKLLREGEMCVCELMTALNRPQSSTSHHLNILKKAGLVKERKEGYWSFYRISDGAVISLLNQAKLLSGKEE